MSQNVGQELVDNGLDFGLGWEVRWYSTLPA